MPGANVTVKDKELLGASVLGNVLRLNALLGLFVVVAREINVCGFKAVLRLLVSVNGIEEATVVSTFPKNSGVELFGCNRFPLHCDVRLLLQDNET